METAEIDRVVEDDAVEKRTSRGTRKVSFNLPVEEIEQLQRLAAERHTTATQVVRQALSTETFLQDLIDRGGRLLSRFGTRGPLQEIHLAHLRRA